MSRLPLLAAVAAVAAFTAVPVAAQDAAGDKVNTVILYGSDPCPKSSDGVINFCAHLPENERYRIPEALRDSSSPQNQAWANKVLSYETVGDFGATSCTPFGAGGELGCTAKMIETAYAEKRGGSDVKFSQLIAQARTERLSTIDAEAAETQGRVEQAEQEYAARLGREQDRADDAKGTQVQPGGTRVVDPGRLATPPAVR
ncbi:MAG: hypothetical protein ABIT09_06790 [Croceibacterium sp.]